MAQIVKMLVSAVVILGIVLGTEGKFRYLYQGKDAKKLAQRSVGLARFIILKNREIKYFGLFVLWVGYNIGPSILDQGASLNTVVPYLTMGFGFFIYLLSRLWPLFGK